MVAFTRRRVLSSLAASLGAVAAGASQLGGAGTATAADEMPGMDHDASAAGAAHSGHAGFARGGVVDSAANGFDPSLIVRDFDWGDDVASCPTGARCASGSSSRRDKEIEIAPGRQVRRLDVQRPRPRAHAQCVDGRPAAHPLQQRQRAPAHGALPRHPPLGDGRRAGPGRGDRRRAHPARPVVHLRVRRRAVRAPPLPLPRLAARGAHREGPLRHVHRRPQGAAARRPTSS